MTRGGRVQETIDIVRVKEGQVVGVGVIVDRSGAGGEIFGKRFVSLMALNIQAFESNDIPVDLTMITLAKPGGS